MTSRRSRPQLNSLPGLTDDARTSTAMLPGRSSGTSCSISRMWPSSNQTATVRLLGNGIAAGPT